MLHFHRWRPVGVTHLYWCVVFDRSGSPGRPVTKVLRQCSRCGRVKDGEQVDGHWSMEVLFGEDARRAALAGARQGEAS